MFHPSGRTTSRRIALISTERILVAALLLSVGCASAATTGRASGTSGGDSDAGTAIPAMLHASAEEWNSGDLDGFLEDYLDTPETSFVGAEVSYGVDQIRARYLRTFWSTGVPEGLLRFENLRVRPLGVDYALAHGTYVLTNRDDGTEQGRGMFSLVLVRTADGWRIIHDHSSAS